MRPTLRYRDGYDDTTPELHEAVAQLQTKLSEAGFDVEADGFFGPWTQETVESFQEARGLVVDGVAGPKTWGSLLGEATAWPTTIPLDRPGMLADLTEANRYTNGGDLRLDGIGAAVMGGIGSRESAWGLRLRPKNPSGTGDFIPRRFPSAHRTGPLPPDGGGFGRGLVQIDFDAHEFARTGDWRSPTKNIQFGVSVLLSNYRLLGSQSSLSGLSLIRGAVAAYNCGAGNVQRAMKAGYDVDYYTTGRNYSADVLNRAGWFQLHGWGGPDGPANVA